jgi:phospholipid/cholesterol/gamma-HCH transport system substrate-binding protein
MSRAVRIRLAAFVVLSAVGIMYVTANYLGFFATLTGSNIDVTATLPSSGGLYEGSEVTYRGVKIGKVSRMDAIDDGVKLELSLQKGTKLPTDSAMFVHNLSAVGEQYLDFEPPDDQGPYAVDGTAFHGDKDSLPVDEGALLVSLNRMVGSVNKNDLKVVVHELGLMFNDTGHDLQTLIDNGSQFLDVASAHTDQTVALLSNGLTVLRTQQGQKENIRSFADDLNTLTTALRDSDGNLRSVLEHTGPAANEIRGLLQDLEPTIPILLSDLTTTGQVIQAHLAGIEQLLVAYPPMIYNGPLGLTKDGWGKVNIQMDYSVPPCTKGYLPPSQWRSTQDLTDAPYFHAKCESPPPYEMRGSNGIPGNAAPNASPPRVFSRSYDPLTGRVRGLVDTHGNPVEVRQPGDMSVLGEDAWKWLLVGPVTGQ